MRGGETPPRSDLIFVSSIGKIHVCCIKFFLQLLHCDSENCSVYRRPRDYSNRNRSCPAGLGVDPLSLV